MVASRTAETARTSPRRAHRSGEVEAEVQRIAHRTRSSKSSTTIQLKTGMPRHGATEPAASFPTDKASDSEEGNEKSSRECDDRSLVM